MPISNATIDYVGRQVDVELLQSVTVPTGQQAVSLSSVSKQSKVVTGVEKALQRYTHLFLTVLGDVVYDQTQGCDFIKGVTTGAVQTRGGLQQYFAIANAQVLQQLNIDNTATDKYGSVPLDEIIIVVTLLDYSVDYASETVMLRLGFTMQSGENVEYIVPVPVPR